MRQGIELGPNHEVANLPKIEQITRQNLLKVVHSNSPNIDMGLLNGSKKSNMEIVRNSKKPTHPKKKSTIFPSEFSEQVTRTGGLAKDVAQFLADHSGPKGSNLIMEVMLLFARSPYKARGNPTSKGTNKK